ncbi:MAG TPA: hypothetical protein VJZ04_06220 [Lachnospiraceae bacterium]|nr:hypothetical protein [Lachnospiraceae bacterium]
MFLRPGTPDDDNREYLPEKIKDTDIVVNENGNNSQPYPERLKEYHGIIADEIEDEWYEYVPESYDPSKKTSLVVSMHGGLMTGWGQAIYTSWTMVAERDGFILVFPNASSNRIWQVQWGKWEADPDQPGPDTNTEVPDGIKISPEDVNENHDARFALGLIERMKKKYNIDEGRIFMQGMSMGDMMTSLFARNFGEILAGAAGSGCASFLSLLYDKDEKIKNKSGHLAIWQSRPELNDIPPEKEESQKVNKYNRLYWMKINESNPIPEISIKGEDNLAFYKGKKADLVYLDIKNRDHGQTLNDAALVWDYLFSGVRREVNGNIVNTGSVKNRKGDEFAIALTSGKKFAWLNNSIVEMSGEAIKWEKLKYHGLDGGQKIRGTYICVPLSFLANAFEMNCEYAEDTLTAVLTLKGGRTLQFARGSIGCVVDRELVGMYCEALHRKKELYVSAEWFCKYVFNLHVSECDGVIYITDHFSELSINMADLIKDLLSGTPVPTNFKKML